LIGSKATPRAFPQRSAHRVLTPLLRYAISNELRPLRRDLAAP
jgi:hypothetical protein